MENNEMLELEEESNIITLTDENGNEQPFEFLDLMEYQGTEYIFLLPVEDDSSEIVILEIEPVDEENESYLAVDDPALLETLYEMFKEKFKDIFTFEG